MAGSSGATFSESRGFLPVDWCRRAEVPEVPSSVAAQTLGACGNRTRVRPSVLGSGHSSDGSLGLTPAGQPMHESRGNIRVVDTERPRLNSHPGEAAQAIELLQCTDPAPGQ